MLIYYVVPPNGIHQYRSSADAQAAFEAGEVWECTGEADLTDEGDFAGVLRYTETVPMRYSECHEVQAFEDSASAVAVPKAFAMQWAPGRVTLLRYHIYPGEHEVGAQHGNVAMGGKGAVQPQKFNPMAGPVDRPDGFRAKGIQILDGERDGETGSGLGYHMQHEAPVPDGPVWHHPHEPDGLTFMEWASRDTPYEPGDWALERYYASRKAAAGFNSLLVSGQLWGPAGATPTKGNSDDRRDPKVQFDAGR